MQKLEEEKKSNKNTSSPVKEQPQNILQVTESAGSNIKYTGLPYNSISFDFTI